MFGIELRVHEMYIMNPTTDCRSYSVHFPGAVNSKFTTSLAVEKPSEKTAMPTYRILDQEGVVVDHEQEPIDISDEEVLKLYKDMVMGNERFSYYA